VAEVARFPIQVVVEDLEMPHWIVALKEAEHLPLLQERFPVCAEEVESWRVDDVPEVLGLIEREVMDLAARLIEGGNWREAQEMTTETETSPAKKRPPGPAQPGSAWSVCPTP
jgi:hypothetical protein